MSRTSTFLGAIGVIGASAALSYAMGKKHQPVTTGATPPNGVTPAPDVVRDAGPEHMENPPRRWDPTDQQADKSFPASDPPGNY